MPAFPAAAPRLELLGAKVGMKIKLFRPLTVCWCVLCLVGRVVGKELVWLVPCCHFRGREG